MENKIELGKLSFYWRMTELPNVPKNCVPDFVDFSFEFIEKYRTSTSDNKDPPQWPWESMPATEWRAFLIRSISFNLFNLLVCTNLVSLVFSLCGMEDPHPTDVVSMPSVPVFFA